MLIKDLSQCVEKTVTLQGWVANKRDGKGLVFIILRDGSSQCQCIGDLNNLGDEIFEKSLSLGLESSIKVTGKVVVDERQIGGYEVHLTALEIIQNDKD